MFDNVANIEDEIQVLEGEGTIEFDNRFSDWWNKNTDPQQKESWAEQVTPKNMIKIVCETLFPIIIDDTIYQNGSFIVKYYGTIPNPNNCNYIEVNNTKLYCQINQNN